MRARLKLRVGQGMARAELVRGSAVLWAGEAPFASLAELEHAVSQLAAREPLPVRPAALDAELEPPLVQLRTLRGLPPVRASQLRALVATQASRFFRRNGKPLVTDACWATGEGRRQGVAVAAAAEEPLVEAVLDGARTAGLVIETIRPAGTPPGTRLGLVPQAERRRRYQRAVLSLRRLALLAGLTWVAAGGVFLVRLERERVAVARELARLERPAEAVRAARRALGQAAAMVETLDRASVARGLVAARAVAVAAAMPDSAFLTSLTLDATGRGELGVVARRAAAVLEALDQSGAVVSPRVEGAVVREAVAGRDRERFTVVFGPGGPR